MIYFVAIHTFKIPKKSGKACVVGCVQAEKLVLMLVASKTKCSSASFQRRFYYQCYLHYRNNTAFPPSAPLKCSHTHTCFTFTHSNAHSTFRQTQTNVHSLLHLGTSQYIKKKRKKRHILSGCCVERRRSEKVFQVNPLRTDGRIKWG